MNPENSSPSIDADALAKLQAWQGRSETLVDDITAAPVRALSATLDRDDAPPTTPDQFAALLQDDLAKWARIVKASGAAVD